MSLCHRARRGGRRRWPQTLQSVSARRSSGGKEGDQRCKKIIRSFCVSWIHHLFLLSVHQLTGDLKFFFCIVYPLLGRDFVPQYVLFFGSGTGSLTHRFALGFLVYQLVYPGLLLPCFESLLLLILYCSYFCLEMVMSSQDPPFCPD